MMRVMFFVSSIFKRFMQLIHKLRLKLKITIKSKIKTIKLEELDMRNLTIEEACELAQQFGKCKTIEQQKKFCKDHNIEITFNVETNDKEEEVHDNQGATTEVK